MSISTITNLLVILSAVTVLVVTLWVVRRGGVVGPERLAPGESVRPLAILTLLAIGGWILIPSIYAASLHAAPAGPGPEPGTRPARQPRPLVLSGREQVNLSLLSGATMLVLLLVAHAAVRPGGLGLLGFHLRQLPRGLIVGLVASLLVIPISLIATFLTDLLWRLIELDHPPAHEMLEILSGAGERGLRLKIYVSAILVAPLFEEVLFRGHLQTLLAGTFTGPRASGGPAPRYDPFATEPRPLAAGAANSSGPGPADQPVLSYAGTPQEPRTGVAARWAAIAAASLLFALVHGALWMMPPIFVLSVCIGYVYERTGNLWSAVVVHMMFNLFNVVVFVMMATR